MSIDKTRPFPEAPTRRRLLGSALAGAATLALPGISRAQNPPTGNVLRLGFIGPGKKPSSATGWALQQGNLQRELAPLGFTGVVTRVFPNGPDLNEAFVAGHLDVGIYGDTPAVVARAQLPDLAPAKPLTGWTVTATHRTSQTYWPRSLCSGSNRYYG